MVKSGHKNITSRRSITTKPHSWPLPSACIIRRRVLAGKFFSFQPVLVLGGSEIWKVRISSLFLLRMRASFWSACAFFPARTLVPLFVIVMIGAGVAVLSIRRFWWIKMRLFGWFEEYLVINDYSTLRWPRGENKISSELGDFRRGIFVGFLFLKKLVRTF